MDGETAVISPAELAEFRTGNSLTQSELASILNDVLDMHYSGTSISQWERMKTPIPVYVQEAIERLRDGVSMPDFDGDGKIPDVTDLDPDEIRSQIESPVRGESIRRPDARPNTPPSVSILPTPMSTPLLETAAVEMWRGIGGMFELLGVTLGAEKVITDRNGMKISLLEMDGRIIASHADQLGKAWARLAEQNAWVARILRSMTTGGAWVEVATVSSATVLDIYRNHAGYQAWLDSQQSAPILSDEPAADAAAVA